MILFYRFLCINFWDSEQINCVNLWLDKQAIGFIFPIHYSEQINCVNLWLDKQAIGFIFPIHYQKKFYIFLWCKTFFILCVSYCFTVFFPVRVIFFICIGIYFSRQSHIPPNKKSWLVSFSYKLTTDF